MIPSVLSAQVRRGLEDFLLTTFPVTNPFFAGTLERLLAKKEEVFRGPYLSLKLPFSPAAGGPARFPGILPQGFAPYRHQERAWERLESTVGLSTLVATGTGSGKTECFLYPILDHCLRHRDKPGIKAILIYPMNALATDQARRLARAIFQNPLLRGNVTAGLYLGREGPDSKRPGVMSETDLIANREAMRAAPPDILLTNYKMLDYLLIRAQDAGLWKNNAPHTLRYLVVDELHSFDGAQGADLACLIRRVKARVKAPAGQLICVGTSATLGDSRPESVHDLADYATRVFSEPFTDDSLIGESVLNTDQFLAGQFVRFFHPPDYARKDDLDPFGYADMPAYVAAQYRAWFQGEITEWEDPSWRYQLADRLREHSFLRNLLYILDGKSKDAGLLLEAIAKQVLEFRHADFEYVELLLISFMTLVSQARIASPQGSQPLVNVRYQLWLRELRRMVSRVGTQPDLAFADDLKPDDLKRSLPVIHCRECGITGWGGVVKDADNTLLADLPTFYDSFFSNSQHVRFVFPGMSADGRLPEYLCAECLRSSMANTPGPCVNCHAPVDRQLRVWIFESTERQTGTGALRGTHNCNACQGVNSLTILGSRAASLTSVLIAQVFGSNFNNDKRMLAFSDNVQDASHRAGLFGARTYAFTLRGALQKCLPVEPVPFTEVASRFLEKWEGELGDSQFVATFLPPDMEWLADFNYLRKNGHPLPDPISRTWCGAE
jgi:DEAD/DEAH box helicase domain-containing protein